MSPRLLSWVLALTVALTFLASPAASSDRANAGVSACTTGSVPAVIAGKYVCLKQGQACKKVLDGQYRIYGFRCARARLTRLPNSTIFSAIVDVGGYRMAMLCRGTGSPTVVLESGFGWSGWIFSRVQGKLSTTARTCIYDRAGLGVSEPRKPPGPVPAARVVDDLHALLTGAGIKPPYVLGGWSLGGFFVRLYAKHYPAEVLGLVTLDGTPLGLPPGNPDILVIGRESFDLGAADVEVAAAPSLGARPLVVLTHGGYLSQDPNEAMWVKFQKQVARLSTSSILARADTSGHSIASDQPNLTVEAFRQVISAVRGGGALPACAATPLPRLHGTCLDPNSP